MASSTMKSASVSISRTPFFGCNSKDGLTTIAKGPVPSKGVKFVTRTSMVPLSLSTDLRILAAVNNCSRTPPSRHPTSVLERAAELLATDEKLHNRVRKPVDLHLDVEVVSKPVESEEVTPVELKRLASQLEEAYRNSPTVSPREPLGEKWREYHGSANWQGLLEPLDPNLRREIVKYGEFAQATYDAFDFAAHSRYCGSCRYNRHKMLDKVHLPSTGYQITKYLYAMSDVHLPKFFGRSNSLDPWSKDSNWMGYVAVSTDEQVKRLGRRDIVVAWRGTVTQLEWMENLRDILHPVGDLGCPKHACPCVKVERGFLSMYTSKDDKTRYNKQSASEQVTQEVRRLVEMYTRRRGEEVSITITGHSLGGALALLNAFEIVAKGVNTHKSNPNRKIPVTVFSFGAPRVGNSAFRKKLEDMGVKTLRMVCKQDMVPKMPGIIFNEGMEKYEQAMGPFLEALPWTYKHVGVELVVDHKKSPFLKKNLDLASCPKLEGYLHLVDGYESSCAPFRAKAKRDVALVNKASDMLRKEMVVPGNWYQVEQKGLIQNCYGRWVQPERDPDDVPSPHHVDTPCDSLAFNF